MRKKKHFLFIFLFCTPFLFAQKEISLNGDWEIIFDHQNEGAEARWHENEVFQKIENKRKIRVPSSWELIEQDYEGVAFYRYTFEVSKDWEGKIIRLQFDAVNYLSEIWLNDDVVGFHEGGFTPFEFRVDNMIQVGKENVLTLRVVGPIVLSNKNIDGVTALETPQWRGGLSGGIWQNVRLIASGNTYVKDVFIEPNIHDNTATFHISIDHTEIKGDSADIEIHLSEASNIKNNVTSYTETLKVDPGLNEHKPTVIVNLRIYSRASYQNLSSL